jgi:hypothetical protein
MDRLYTKMSPANPSVVTQQLTHRSSLQADNMSHSRTVPEVVLTTSESSHKSADLLEKQESESCLTPKEREELIFTDKHSSPDVYINATKDAVWHSWVGNLEPKPLRFETRSGQFVVALRSPVDAWLGKHRHRGPVTAVTVKGTWGYKECISKSLSYRHQLIH